MVYHAAGESLASRNTSSREENLLRFPEPELPSMRKILDSIHAKSHNGVGKGRVFACNNQIAYPYQH